MFEARPTNGLNDTAFCCIRKPPLAKLPSDARKSVAGNRADRHETIIAGPTVVYSACARHGNRRVPGTDQRGKWAFLADWFMAHCKFCGLEIEWGQVQGATVPLDPDFTDHRKACSAWTHDSRAQVRDRNHESRVKDFLLRKAKKR